MLIYLYESPRGNYIIRILITSSSKPLPYLVGVRGSERALMNADGLQLLVYAWYSYQDFVMLSIISCFYSRPRMCTSGTHQESVLILRLWDRQVARNSFLATFSEGFLSPK